jgi:feruloyl esterase
MSPGSGYSVVFGGRPFQYTVDWFRYVIRSNPSWDISKLSLAEMAYASQLNPADAETWNGDLTPFKTRGAKVIHYHGHEDPLISSANSARYYNHVAATMKQSPSQLDSFYRYFQISGMGHCGGGSGANQIGQSGASAPSLSPDANVLFAIVRWVEGGVAPDTILGTNDERVKGVKFQRRHCRYPRRNRFKGKGNAMQADSWECVE